MGPMLKAERRARRTGKLTEDNADRMQTDIDESLEPEEGVPHLWWNAVIPMLVTTFFGESKSEFLFRAVV